MFWVAKGEEKRRVIKRKSYGIDMKHARKNNCEVIVCTRASSWKKKQCCLNGFWFSKQRHKRSAGDKATHGKLTWQVHEVMKTMENRGKPMENQRVFNAFGCQGVEKKEGKSIDKAMELI